MSDSKAYRWAWFALAVVVAVAWAYTNRRQYYGCDTEYCVVVNRWSGRVGLEPNAAAEMQMRSKEGSAATDSFLSQVRR